jgi:hypothetical protein
MSTAWHELTGGLGRSTRGKTVPPVYHSHALRTEVLSFSWLYSLFLAIDANFRLKRKAVSSDKADPGLSRGWSYFVSEAAFKAHLLEHGNQQQDVSQSHIDSNTCLIVSVYSLVPARHTTPSTTPISRQTVVFPQRESALLTVPAMTSSAHALWAIYRRVNGMSCDSSCII